MFLEFLVIDFNVFKAVKSELNIFQLNLYLKETGEIFSNFNTYFKWFIKTADISCSDREK